MGKQYNAELQAKVEAYMKGNGESARRKLAPMMNLKRSGIKPVPPQRL